MSSEVKNAINTEEAFNPGLQVLKCYVGPPTIAPLLTNGQCAL